MENCAADRKRGRWLCRHALVLAACTVALAGACASTAPKGPVLLHPAPPAAKDYALVQGAIVYSGDGFSVSARPWDYRLVAAEVARSGEPSPFGKDEEAAGRFLFVRLRFENLSTKTLLFNPMRAALVEGTEAPILPVENADLVAFAGDDLASAEALARTFRRMSFDLTASVPPGGTLERYLIFLTPEEPPKKLELELEDLWLGSSSFDLLFPFETFEGK